MPAPRKARDKTARLNCGLWRERGIERTSISCFTPFARSKSMNFFLARVEWPTVKIKCSPFRGFLPFVTCRFDFSFAISDSWCELVPDRAQSFTQSSGSHHSVLPLTDTSLPSVMVRSNSSNSDAIMLADCLHNAAGRLHHSHEGICDLGHQLLLDNRSRCQGVNETWYF